MELTVSAPNGAFAAHDGTQLFPLRAYYLSALTGCSNRLPTTDLSDSRYIDALGQLFGGLGPGSANRENRKLSEINRRRRRSGPPDRVLHRFGGR